METGTSLVRVDDSSDDEFVSKTSLYPRKCDCGKIFQTKQSYFKHSKACTGKSESTYPRECNSCHKLIQNKVQYFRHKNKCIKQGEETEDVQGGQVPAETSSSSIYPRKCEKCPETFNYKQAYSRHLSKCSDGVKPRANYKAECYHEGCTLKFYHRTAMIDHLVKDHMSKFKINELTFNSMDEFLDWKHNVATVTFTYFTAPCGVKGSADDEKVQHHYFSCQFDAHDKDISKDSKNKWKWGKGRIPTGMSCPARMLVAETPATKQIKVKFMETHNHRLDYDLTIFQRVPEQIRNLIKTCVMAGKKPKEIQEILRGDVGNLDNRDTNIAPAKQYFIEIQYINHISQQVKCDRRLHKNDYTSVDMHVRNLMRLGRFSIDGIVNTSFGAFEDGKFSPILCYKPQGQPTVLGDPQFDLLPTSDKLFVLGFQTQKQLEMMKEGCKTVMCVDSTYNTTQYGFYLINMVVPDEFGKGYPCAHFITNYQDGETVELCFRSIKERCPDLEVNLLVTDDDQAEYKAFLAVFPGTRHVLCIWHVKRNWGKNLKMIGDRQLKLEIFHSLSVLMYERHEPSFHEMLDAFVAKYENESKCNTYLDYFKKYYKNRTEKWALCYRNFRHGNTDTTMYCESLHNKLKTFYMERVQNKRCDDLMEILLRMEKDYYMTHWKAKAEKRKKVTVSETERRKHTRGMSIRDEDVFQYESDMWVVKSQTKEDEDEYFVFKPASSKCPSDHCYLECIDPLCKGLCVHLYTCTCPCLGGMCKHIHKVHSMCIREVVSTNYSDRVGDLCDQDEQDAGLQETHPIDVDLESKEIADQKLREECNEILQRISGRLDQPGVSGLLPHLKKQLQQLDILTQNLGKPSHSQVPGKFDITMTVSGPQKLVPQKDLTFFRTAKKPKNTQALKNPNYQQKQTIKTSLLSLKGRAELKRKRVDSDSETPHDRDPLTLPSLPHTSSLSELPPHSESCSAPRTSSSTVRHVSSLSTTTPKLVSSSVRSVMNSFPSPVQSSLKPPSSTTAVLPSSSPSSLKPIPSLSPAPTPRVNPLSPSAPSSLKSSQSTLLFTPLSSSSLKLIPFPSPSGKLFPSLSSAQTNFTPKLGFTDNIFGQSAFF